MKWKARRMRDKKEAAKSDTSDVADIIHRPVKYWAPVVNLSERTLRDAIRAGELGHVRLGDRILISRRHIEAWLAANERKPRTSQKAA
jgi:excisionase family DNA binding protein